LNAYPSNFAVHIVQFQPGQPAQVSISPLAQLARQSLPDTLTVLYLPADDHSGFSTFQETIAHLRAPDGCPWDQKQTHQSLRPYLLEETYEVLEALDAGDMPALAEELGDLLLQVVLHTQVAIDNGAFKMADVIDHINRKLVRRHPHVFGTVTVDGVAAVTANWEAIKQQEKAAKGEKAQAASVLDGVPPALPALAQALSISDRAVRVGFEWPNIEGVMEKVLEEAQEIAEASTQAELESEIGDLLFSVVNLARWRQVDPESALRETNARFTRRFKQMEALATAQGVRLSELPIDALETLWTRAKEIVHGP
jgi:tetrapyrrole methylase family protein/MazG family protein